MQKEKTNLQEYSINRSIFKVLLKEDFVFKLTESCHIMKL